MLPAGFVILLKRLRKCDRKKDILNSLMSDDIFLFFAEYIFLIEKRKYSKKCMLIVKHVKSFIIVRFL